MILIVVVSEWSAENSAYSTSNENQTATKCCGGEAVVLYSKSYLYTAGQSITFRVLDAGSTCPGDGVGLSLMNSDSHTLRRPGAAYVTVDGNCHHFFLPPFCFTFYFFYNLCFYLYTHCRNIFIVLH